jgi:predicted acylesterase/phospholipase RssA
MSRALVLNAGASLAAYQAGALRHVVRERGMEFDLLAGTGIGAMNAAFVACGALDALEALWARMSALTLVRPSPRRFWLGPLSGAPQRAEIARHVSEERLAAGGARLLFNTLDLRTGRQVLLEYPGAGVPLLDGLMAAVATPAAVAPVEHGGRQLAEGTFVESFLLRDVLDRGPEEVVAIAVASARDARERRYRTWRAVSDRAMAMNLDHDVRSSVEHAERVRAAARARERLRGDLVALVAERVPDASLAGGLRDRIGDVYGDARPPSVTVISPSQSLGYPMWRFPRAAMRAAAELGHRDASAALAAEGAPA